MVSRWVNLDRSEYERDKSMIVGIEVRLERVGDSMESSDECLELLEVEVISEYDPPVPFPLGPLPIPLGPCLANQNSLPMLFVVLKPTIVLSTIWEQHSPHPMFLVIVKLAKVLFVVLGHEVALSMHGVCLPLAMIQPAIRPAVEP